MSVEVLAPDTIESLIHTVRGHRVILDEDIAALYGVETRQLVRAVQRNAERFPQDFMFRLTAEEFGALWRDLDKSGRHGGRRKVPYVFTEHGVAMLSGVLRSDRAIRVNVQIIRAFVRMRAVLAAHEDLAVRLDELEAKYDQQFSVVFDAIRQLMLPPAPPHRPVGFETDSQGTERRLE